MSAVGEVERYPPGRWTRNYLPVDPLPARTEAPLDCLATGITDEKGFWVKTACQKGDSNTPLPEQGMLPLPTHPSHLSPQLVEAFGSSLGNTDLRQTSCHLLELHRLLIVGIEVLDGVGESHSQIWEAQNMTSLVHMKLDLERSAYHPFLFPVRYWLNKGRANGQCGAPGTPQVSYLPTCRAHSPSSPGRQRGRAW